MPITDEIIQRHAPRIAYAIRDAAQGSPLEAEFREAVEDLLAELAAQADVPLRTHHEYTVASGRADTVYNRLVIEYKRPGTLSRNRHSGPNAAAVDQAKSYIEDIEKSQRLKDARLVGVVTDGRWMIYCRHVADRWHVEDPAPVATDSVKRLLSLLVQLQTGAALIPENLIEDFGSDTITAQRTTRALYSALRRWDDELTRKLFEQWQTLFGEITGYEEGGTGLQRRASFKKFARGMGLNPCEVEPAHLLFSVHTYFALLVKLIAWLTLSRYVTSEEAPFSRIHDLPTEELKAALADMERGGVFRRYGIRNLLEGDFFGWYLRAWDEKVEQYLRRIIKTLSRYDPATLEAEPELTRDLLKRIYQGLLPRHLRHDLGEYYTADWLAQRVLNMVDGGSYEGDPRKRVLDPACGSGTFLVLAIRATRDFCRANSIPDSDALQLILANIVGIDLNPLAVVAARTNYLLALGEFLEAHDIEEKPVDIPVYLADSILTPSRGRDLFTQDTYRVGTAVGVFGVPRQCTTRERIDALAAVLDRTVEDEEPIETFLRRVREEVGLTTSEFYAADAALTTLYEQMAELHSRGMDGVWARIIKNAFAPLFLEPFDYVVGNPPWVNWENLPEDYRRETTPLWAKHKLFPKKGLEAILGGSKDDISILMTYVALDEYLRDEGRLGFVITQSVLKTAGAGEGFRRFELGDGTPVGVLHADDMSEIKPFPGVGNRTAVLVLRKGQETEYPVPYTHWRGEKWGRGRRRTIPEDLTLDEVKAMTVLNYFVAEPVDANDATSTWISGRRHALSAVRKVLGSSDYRARAGICTWMNAVYWVRVVGRRGDGLLVVSNITEGAKRKVEKVQAAIEPELIYPLLRGRDVKRWEAIPSAHNIVTHRPEMGLSAIPEDEMTTQFPRTYAYLERFEAELRSRSGYERYFSETDPFYAVFDVGKYTFAPHKVVWCVMASEMTAAVVGTRDRKPITPQSIVAFVATESDDEAHFICAVMNAAPFNFALQSYSQKGGKSFGTPSILENVRVPQYDVANPAHRQLAALSQKAHTATAAGEVGRVVRIEAEIDQETAQLWALTDDELLDIHRSLEELQ
ncbi:MAG: N-6 DNA methylase [bacterium]